MYTKRSEAQQESKPHIAQDTHVHNVHLQRKELEQRVKNTYRYKDSGQENMWKRRIHI